jgi:hypothetical protein
VGEVGQLAWEEVDFESVSDPGGRNYGWEFMEGTHCYNPPVNCNDGSLTLPIYDYPHEPGYPCWSVTGGVVYRGSALSPTLLGTYWFADYCMHRIFSLRYDGVQMTDLREWTSILDPPGAANIWYVATIAEDPAGEMYLLEYLGAPLGDLWKIVPGPFPAGVEDAPRVVALDVGPGVPNPFRGAVRWELSLDRGTPWRATIVDAAGRLVRRLQEPRPGVGAIEWDGNDDAGHPSTSGVYFLRVEADGASQTRAVTRLR